MLTSSTNDVWKKCTECSADFVGAKRSKYCNGCLERGIFREKSCRCGTTVVVRIGFGSKGNVRYGEAICRSCKGAKRPSRSVRSLRGTTRRLTERELLEVLQVYDEVGTFVGAARICGVGDKTVRRIIMRREEIEKTISLNAAVEPPAPVSEEGNCTRLYERAPEDLDLFFPQRDYSRAQRLVKERYCDGCPVRAICFEHAMKNETYGTWAGVTEKQRERARLDPEYLQQLMKEVGASDE